MSLKVGPEHLTISFWIQSIPCLRVHLELTNGWVLNNLRAAIEAGDAGRYLETLVRGKSLIGGKVILLLSLFKSIVVEFNKVTKLIAGKSCNETEDKDADKGAEESAIFIIATGHQQFERPFEQVDR